MVHRVPEGLYKVLKRCPWDTNRLPAPFDIESVKDEAVTAVAVTSPSALMDFMIKDHLKGRAALTNKKMQKERLVEPPDIWSW